MFTAHTLVAQESIVQEPAPIAKPGSMRIRSKSDYDLPHPAYRPWHQARPLQIDPREARWRHSSWARERRNTAEVLYELQPDSHSYYKFFHCGADAVTQWSPSKKRYCVRCTTCKHRACMPCRRRTAMIVRGNLSQQCVDVARRLGARALRAVTLTIRASDRPLREQLSHLLKSFRRLRQSKQVKKLFAGGTYVVEVKIGEGSGKWHPHLHIITEGRFVDQNTISQSWEKASKGSTYVWVKAVGSIKDAVNHDCKYITKAVDHSVYSSKRRLREFITATRSVRFFSTFGSWRGIPMTKRKEAVTDWERVDSLCRLLSRADNGERLARDIIRNLQDPGADPADQKTIDPP